MHSLEFLGFIAGFFAMIALIPQVYKTWKLKSAKDVSMQMFIIHAISNFFWIAYGFVFNKPAIYIANITVFTLATVQIVLKIKYKK
jgi:MtN3 and saliva related transmembrane protein